MMSPSMMIYSSFRSGFVIFCGKLPLRHSPAIPSEIRRAIVRGQPARSRWMPMKPCANKGSCRSRVLGARQDLPVRGNAKDPHNICAYDDFFAQGAEAVWASIHRGRANLGIGGAEGDRTPDLRIANATLSQLSYGPTRPPMGGESRTSRGAIRTVSRRLQASRRTKPNLLRTTCEDPGAPLDLAPSVATPRA